MFERDLAIVLLVGAVGCSGSGPRPGTGPAQAPPAMTAETPAPDAGTAAPSPAPRPAGFEQDCYTLVRDVDAWYPVAALRDDEREMFSWIVRLRVGEECTWDERTFADRSCFAAARDVDEERACVEALDFQLASEHRDPLGDLAAAMKALDAVPSCETAAEAYYSNFRWWVDHRGSLTGTGFGRDLEQERSYTPNAMHKYTDDEQAALIDQTRAAFAQACAEEGWTGAVRRCVVAAWPGFERNCLLGIDGDPARPRRWTAPPLDLVTTFDATCDAYLAAAAELATCPHDPRLDAHVSDAVTIARIAARVEKPKKPDPEISKTCKRRHAELGGEVEERCPRRVGWAFGSSG